MKKIQHLFEGGIYLVSNHAVANNRMFDNEELQTFFHSRMEKHLSPVCDILAYCLHDDEFQILVKLKSKERIGKYFLSKKRNRELDLTEAPDETYVFSQAMANLQVSFVKYYNFVYKRSGALMAGRFVRNLIESEKEMNSWVVKLNQGIKRHSYPAKWAAKEVITCGAMTSTWLYTADYQLDSKYCRRYQNIKNLNLGGYFLDLPPAKLRNTKNYFLLRFNQLFGPKPGHFF